MTLEDPQRTQLIRATLERMGDIVPGSVRMQVSGGSVYVTASVAPVATRPRGVAVRVSISEAEWNAKTNAELAETLYAVVEKEFAVRDARATPAPKTEGTSFAAPNFTKEMREAVRGKVQAIMWGAPTDDPNVLALRLTIKDAMTAVYLATPQGRRQSLAVTHLEEALMWATKAVYEQE